jgi:putative addiction module CopG family antidote
VNVTLSSKAEAMVRRRIESGQFDNPNDVVAAALDFMDQRDQLAQLDEDVVNEDLQSAQGEVKTRTTISGGESNRNADDEDHLGMAIE